MKRLKSKRINKGFTLIELIIVIVILVIIMLIASLAYSGIQQRIKIRSDKATCGEIGKALAVREADLDKSKGIKLYPEVVEYDTLEGVENYIKKGLVPQSMPDGGYIVTAIQTDTGKKILVGIGKNGQEISSELYVDNQGAGWCWAEGKEVGEFVTENILSFTPVKTLAGITGGNSESGGSSLASIMETSEVAVGSYIDYTGGDYTGKWVVLRNNGGTIEIISKESVGNFTLEGAEGYKNAVKILNDKCLTYVNSTYATSGRSVGETSDSISQINESSYPLAYGVSGSPYEDTYYMSDQTLIENNIALQHSSGYVWMGSRYVNTSDDITFFHVRALSTTGSIHSAKPFLIYSDGSTINAAHYIGVRPVITLKSGIRIVGGTGASGNPYQISL